MKTKYISQALCVHPVQLHLFDDNLSVNAPAIATRRANIVPVGGLEPEQKRTDPVPVGEVSTEVRHVILPNLKNEIEYIFSLNMINIVPYRSNVSSLSILV